LKEAPRGYPSPQNLHPLKSASERQQEEELGLVPKEQLREEE
jgi:hypothetical protein